MNESTTLPSRGSRRNTVTFLAVLALAGVVAGVGALTGAIPNPFSNAPKTLVAQGLPDSDARPLVKVVHPQKVASVPITLESLATVEPYFRADLRARAAGFVRSIHFDIGDKVKAGDALLEIDVPESDQDVVQKQAIVVQREQEQRVSESKLKEARSAKEVSAATIRLRAADVTATEATRDLKKGRYERYKALAKNNTVVGPVVEEEERDYLACEAAVQAAQANVERARADFNESESKIEAAAADIELKKAQVETARKDVDRAKIVADYAKLRAPFDGVVIARSVDPGSFVQNATAGASEVLISIARVDLVTVRAKFADTAAPFVVVGLPAEVHMDDLPGATIAAKVTRYSPSIQNNDRTMLVEVDLFNGDDADYERLLKASEAERPTKGARDPLPLRAFPAKTPGYRLVAGMTGTIKLSVGGFGESAVLPSTAVYTRGGTSYILVVEDGKTKQLPVRVQLNDGRSARVAVIARRTDGNGAVRDMLTELTGREDVIVSRQLEIGEGVAVRVGAD